MNMMTRLTMKQRMKQGLNDMLAAVRPHRHNAWRQDSKLISMALSILLSIGASQSVFADTPFYFVAKVAPEGSQTSDGAQQRQVYLRWDVMEGQLPDDIVSFKLYRNGELFGSYPAESVMSEAEIRNLYVGAAQQRRLLETVSLLRAQADNDPETPTFSANDFAQVIKTQLETNSFWANLASRRDFNLALARYKGAKDVAGVGLVRYELQAENSVGNSKRVGYVELDTDQVQNVLPAEGFAQLQLSQCDLPDIKDHYSVALNWQAAGAENVPDRVGNQIFVSGYDLYRSRENLPSSVLTAPTRNLASEAANLGTTPQGHVAFSDLQKVNETLITVTPDGDDEVSEWLETQADLLAAGLVPGDRRAYYLVPRDFTGNFGPTSKTLVVIGDMSRPPAPWDIDTYYNDVDDRLEISFEQIGRDAWLESFGQDKRVCRYDDESGVLSFVGTKQNCATDAQRRVQLKVADYLLYRFDNFADASRFKDSDGDGYSDRAERPTNTQCKVAEPAGGNLVENAFSVEERSNHSRVFIRDTEPAENKGDVYWYRVAARSDSGRLSFLSEPIRVNFPDRTLPARPQVDLSIPNDGTEICGCEVNYNDTGSAWQFAVDSTIDSSFALSCGGSEFSVTDKTLASASGGACRDTALTSACGVGVIKTLQSPGNGIRNSCSAELPSELALCSSGQVRIEPQYCDSKPAPEGVVTGPLTISVTPASANQCVSLYRQIAGTSIKVSTSCGEASAQDEYVVESGEFCGYAVSHDQNNNISTSQQIACRQVIDSSQPTRLLAPRVVQLLVTDTEARVRVDIPRQRSALLEVELQQAAPVKGEPERKTIAVPNPELSSQSLNFDLPALVGANDQWCVKARVLGPSSGVESPYQSDWSKASCTNRSSSENAAPKWLPWPGTNTADQGEDLSVRLNRDWGFLPASSVLSGGVHIPLLRGIETDCSITPSTVTFFGDVGQDEVTDGAMLANVICIADQRNRLNSSYISQLNFMVFRQSRFQGVESDWVQVSPLIDYVHWADNGVSKDGLSYRLKDPYIWVSQPDVSEPEIIDLNFVDRVSLAAGREYRYQVVYFDYDHALDYWRGTPWILIPSTSSSNASGTSNALGASSEQGQSPLIMPISSQGGVQ